MTMDALEILVPITLMLSITTLIVLRGPIGKALADRLAGRVGPGAAKPDDQTVAELDEVRHRLADLEERLDFTERVLAKQREGQRLGAGE